MDKIYGLSDLEVCESRNKFGSNNLNQIKNETFFQKYLKSFDDPIITILLFALIINVIFTFLGKVDWFECAGILISVLIGTLISTLSEYKNEKNFKHLSEISSKTESKVYRNGILCLIDTDELVTSDFVLLQSGDIVPADGIIVDGNIKVDQSVLNGENDEVEKFLKKDKKYDTECVDFWNPNMVFRGTIVTSGECMMKITKVGNNTVYGKLRTDTDIEKRDSPLTIKLHSLAKSISKFGYLGAGLTIFIILFQKIFIDNSFDSILIYNYFQNYSQFFSDITEAFIMGIVVIVVAVPEGLPLMISIVCSLNMKKMLKSNVLVRKLSGIETAGSLNVLFCDKTGTLTKGKLEVSELILGNLDRYTNINSLSNEYKKFLTISIKGNTSSKISNNKVIGGNTTDRALVNFILNDNKHSFYNIKKISENPFTSATKFSSSLISGDISATLYKGAPEKLLNNCSYYIDANGNKKNLLNKTKIEDLINKYAIEQKRLILTAYTEEKESLNNIPKELTLIGIAVLKDEIRYNVSSSVEAVNRAGIQVIMITGDKKETAMSIAKETGILKNNQDIILTSNELACYSDDMLKNIFKDIRVIARALPSDKSRLVRISQELNLVSGMTGDGVNDCPALKRADVGFSMGSGTEAAKEAGDIIILDNNFTSIKNAILYGRTIYKSIKKFITFQLTINIAAVTVSLLGPILGVYKPLNISQMLWINLVMDTLGAIAFGGEAALSKYLLERPKKRTEKILDKKAWGSILTGGIFVSLISCLFFSSEFLHSFFRSSVDDTYFYTGYFSFFIFSCIFNAFNTRCESIDLLDHLSCNKSFIVIISLIFITQILMIYLGGAFLRTSGLIFKEWLVVFLLSVLIIPIDIIRKIIVK